MNKQTYCSILVANNVCDSIKNASSMGALLIPKLQCIPAGIRIHNIHIDTIIYSFHILQLYIPYHIYPIEKCCDPIMNMVSKFWSIYTSTRLVSQNGDTSPTLGFFLFEQAHPLQ